MSDSRSIIAASIASLRDSGGGDTAGGDSIPESVSSSTPDETGDTSDALDPAPAGSGDEGDDATPPVAAAPEPLAEKPAEKEPEKPENDDFDKEPEFTEDGKGKKRINSIPHPRVAKMVQSAVKKTEERLAGEFKAREQDYEGRISQYEQYGEIMATDPGRFMQMLAKAYPGYQRYLGATDGALTPNAQQPRAVADDPEPEPDGQLSDGTPAYTKEGFKKHQEWQARQIERQVMDKVSERYGWIDKQREEAEFREAQRPVVQAQMEAAQQWEGFKEHFTDILKELQQDSAEAARRGAAPQLSLHDAYRIVMGRKFNEERETLRKRVDELSTDRNKLRAEILAELKQQPLSTAATPAVPPAAPTPAAEPGDSKAIIRAAIAGLKRAS